MSLDSFEIITEKLIGNLNQKNLVVLKECLDPQDRLFIYKSLLEDSSLCLKAIRDLKEIQKKEFFIRELESSVEFVYNSINMNLFKAYKYNGSDILAYERLDYLYINTELQYILDSFLYCIY